MYLRVSASGYATENADASANAFALSRVKQALEFGRCLGLFRLRYASDQAHCFSHSAIDPKTEQYWVTQSLEVTSYLARVNLVDGVFESAAATLEVVDNSKPEVQAEIFLKKYRTASEVLRRPLDDSDATAIRTACEWSFDSRAGRNETIAFLQSCIGLEAILGEATSLDEPLVGQLSDRCAYLIGKTIRDRRDIKKLFRDVYNVRSKLVHGRSARLEARDADILHSARQLLTDVISREATLMSGK